MHLGPNWVEYGGCGSLKDCKEPVEAFDRFYGSYKDVIAPYRVAEAEAKKEPPGPRPFKLGR